MKLGHDAAISRLLRAKKNVTLRTVADAFVASLTSAPPRYRTGLVSYALAAHLEAHQSKPYGPKNRACRECGFRAESAPKTGQSLPGEIVDAMIDLESFASLAPVKPNKKDWDALDGILKIIARAPKTARNPKLEIEIHAARRALGMKGTKYDWRYVLETLSQIGALEVEGRPGLLRAWTPYAIRDERPSVRVEVCAPLAWWTRAHGIRTDALERVFGHGQLRIPKNVAPAGVVPSKPKAIERRDSALVVGDVIVLALEPRLFHGLLITGMGSDKGGVYPVAVDLGRHERSFDAGALIEIAARRANEATPRARRAYHLFLSKRDGKKLTTKLGHVKVGRKDDCTGVAGVFRLADAIRFARDP